MHESS
jgi:hypothetical protein